MLFLLLTYLMLRKYLVIEYLKWTVAKLLTSFSSEPYVQQADLITLPPTLAMCASLFPPFINSPYSLGVPPTPSESVCSNCTFEFDLNPCKIHSVFLYLHNGNMPESLLFSYSFHSACFFNNLSPSPAVCSHSMALKWREGFVSAIWPYRDMSTAHMYPLSSAGHLPALSQQKR